jgi:hypothetical protein
MDDFMLKLTLNHPFLKNQEEVKEKTRVKRAEEM